jgi:hypothetical protein
MVWQVISMLLIMMFFDVLVDRIKSTLPYFEEKYDPYAYIEWELTVDNEF